MSDILISSIRDVLLMCVGALAGWFSLEFCIRKTVFPELEELDHKGRRKATGESKGRT